MAEGIEGKKRYGKIGVKVSYTIAEYSKQRQPVDIVETLFFECFQWEFFGENEATDGRFATQ